MKRHRSRSSGKDIASGSDAKNTAMQGNAAQSTSQHTARSTVHSTTTAAQRTAAISSAVRGKAELSSATPGNATTQNPAVQSPVVAGAVAQSPAASGAVTQSPAELCTATLHIAAHGRKRSRSTTLSRSAAALRAAVRSRLRKRSKRLRQQMPKTINPQVVKVHYESGFQAGYEEGMRAGYNGFAHLFDGTSIIIPTYNQADYLKECLDSLAKHTEGVYEVIVIDNASTDGTAELLKERAGQVRSRVLESNRGFAGAINVGLTMAKGRSILLLNNDTVVTPRWLDNLHRCLDSDSGIGMVGPVTNYISGVQKIDVAYQSLDDMQRFAEANNHSDPGRWETVERLTGFCLLFRRSLLEETGLFDEGFEVGNFEDEDYNIRVRLRGYRLVMARDSFIHHYGSISMKALGERFHQVNEQNEHFYMEKWGDPARWIGYVKEWAARYMPQGIERLPYIPSEASFFPQHVLVQGTHETRFWLENDQRRPVEGELHLPVVQLSQMDVQRWPIGELIGAAAVEQCWQGDGNVPDDGRLAAGSDGQLYWLEKGMRRRIVSTVTLKAWQLELKPACGLSPLAVDGYPEGLPIIAPVRLKARI